MFESVWPSLWERARQSWSQQEWCSLSTPCTELWQNLLLWPLYTPLLDDLKVWRGCVRSHPELFWSKTFRKAEGTVTREVQSHIYECRHWGRKLMLCLEFCSVVIKAVAYNKSVQKVYPKLLDMYHILERLSYFSALRNLVTTKNTWYKYQIILCPFFLQMSSAKFVKLHRLFLCQ